MQQQMEITGGTTHAELDAWVKEVAAHTRPDAVVWVTGSDEEIAQINETLVEAGTFTKLAEDKKPESYHALSDPDDVARVEGRTSICSEQERDAGPTNNWMDPQEMKDTLWPLFEGSMQGRTMYVIPFVMGHLDAEDPKFGVEITDSAYVVASMRIMARIGSDVLATMEESDAAYVKGLHSVGAPLADGEEDVPWPCNETKYIVHFPEERAIWSYGSGYGGNALLGKKCYALRIASVMARDEGWLAEHMLILKLTSPEGEVHYVAGAFPSACGKTNLAMIQPTLDGWKAELVGDDISWMRFGDDGRLYAVNPEFGLFGVAPGTGRSTNPVAMDTIERGHSIFTNVARTADGDVWWEGMTKEAPAELTDWHGNPWTPDCDVPAAHPNSRFTTTLSKVPNIAPDWDEAAGVPIDAIIFGGRTRDREPLIRAIHDVAEGVYDGLTLGAEATFAAEGVEGQLRYDPMSNRPFMAYGEGDYARHYLDLLAQVKDKPLFAHVNWFQKDPQDGHYVWPGFRENLRPLLWLMRLRDGEVTGRKTAVGILPTEEELDLQGLDLPKEDLERILSIDVPRWQQEMGFREEHLNQFDRLPEEIWEAHRRVAKDLQGEA